MAIHPSEMSEVTVREVALKFWEENFSLESGADYAKSRINAFAQGSQDIKKLLAKQGGGGGGLGWQEGLVVAAIWGMKEAHDAVKEQLKTLGRARLAFDKELVAGNATFLIPINVEKQKLAREQGGMAEFLALAKEDPYVFRMLGLKESHMQEKELEVDATLLSSLPFYEMSSGLPPPSAAVSLSDKVRQAIALFLGTQMKGYLKEIKQDFKDDTPVSDFIASWWKGDNFLNNYRGPRLIIMTIGNLLWNMLYPIDPITKDRLDLKEQVKRCNDACNFINKLLVKSDKNDKNYLDTLDPSGHLTHFVQMTEMYLHELNDAYEDDKNKSLNLDDITVHAQRAARILNNNIFYILYRKKNMSETLSSYVYYLHLILKRDPGIFSVLNDFKNVKSPLKNNVPRTVFDILLVFCQLDKDQRNKFFESLRSSDKNIRKSFALTLEGLYKNFIHPIYKAEKDELFSKKWGEKKGDFLVKLQMANDKKVKDKACEYGFYQVMSLIAMTVNDFNLELDSEDSKLAAARSQVMGTDFFTCRYQINQITARGYENNQKKFPERKKDEFGCDLSVFMSLEEQIENKINELISKQYKISQYTYLISTLKKFTNKYHDYLLEPKFKRFLINSLTKVNLAFGDLNRLCTELNSDINFITTEDRKLIGIINNLESDLSSEIASFMSEVESSTQKLNSKDFENNIKKEIVSNIQKIQDRFSAAFTDDAPELSDLKDLVLELKKDLNESDEIATVNTEHIENSENEEDDVKSVSVLSDTTADAETVVDAASFYQIQKVSGLILNCLHSLSNASNNGVKGEQLRTIYEIFITKPSYSIEDLKNTCEYVGKIVCAYRPSYFFQAEYAKTRSAQYFIKEMIFSMQDEHFPLAEWLLGEDNIERLKRAYSIDIEVEHLLLAKCYRQALPVSTEQFIDSPVLNL